MVIGNDDSLAANDDARTKRILHPLAPVAKIEGIAEELPEEGIILKGGSPTLHHPLGIDIDHSGRRLFDQRSERQGNFLSGFGWTLLSRQILRRQENKQGRNQ